ncbi:MAG TPA: hypothetical protein VJQ09_08955, partial [Candidatus Limnocylindria bacterium]|nr:hypothetical protein [Candidatus Limnocylindria bacterium]
PARTPAQMPMGLYRVSEVYLADVVTRSGDLTSYSTTTRHEVTDTYARVLDQVGTGARSAYDGAAFNGRAALSRGALVAGTYYQNYVFDGTTFRPVSIVFFQDDSELARRGARPVPSPAPILWLPPRPSPQPAPRPIPIDPPAPWPRPIPTPAPITIGVDPTGEAGVLDRVEVARGARYSFRVNIRGSGTLTAWAFVSGANDASTALGWHAPGEPLSGQWLRLPPPGTPWALTLRVRVAQPGGGTIERDGTVQVWVRSPAVVE